MIRILLRMLFRVGAGETALADVVFTRALAGGWLVRLGLIAGVVGGVMLYTRSPEESLARTGAPLAVGVAAILVGALCLATSAEDDPNRGRLVG